MNRKLYNNLIVNYRGKLATDKNRVPPKKKFMRTKEAMQIYGMGRTKLTEIARKANAYIKVDGTVLLEIEAFDNYIEAHRVIEEDISGIDEAD